MWGVSDHFGNISTISYKSVMKWMLESDSGSCALNFYFISEDFCFNS